MGPLVGRVDEQRQIAALVDAVRDGRTQVLLLTGPRGVGKSRLAGTVASEMSTYTHLMLEAEREVAFGAIDRLLDEQLPETAQELVALRAEAGIPTFAIAVVNLIEKLDGPFALVIDDLENLDPGSQEAFWHIVRRLDNVPALFVGTTRSLDSTFATRLLQHITVGRRGLHIELGPLTADGVQALIRSTLFAPLSPRHIAAVMEATGGSPRLLGALVEHIREFGVGSLDEAISDLGRDPGAGLPHWSAAAGLSDADAGGLLTLALGGPLSHREFAAATARLGRGTVDLGALHATGLLDDRRLALRQSAVAAAIAAHAPPRDVTAVHRTLGQVLTGLQRLRHRVAASAGRPDPALVAELSRGAAEAARIRDFDTACQLAAWACSLDVRLVPLASLYALRSRRAPLIQKLEPQIRSLLPGPTRTVLLCALDSLAVGVEDLPAAEGIPLAELDDTLLLILAHAASLVGRNRTSTGNFSTPGIVFAVREELAARISRSRADGMDDNAIAEQLTLHGLLVMWSAFGHTSTSVTATIRAMDDIAESLSRVPAAAPACCAALTVAASLNHHSLRNRVAARQIGFVERMPATHPDFSLDTAVLRYRIAFMSGDWDTAHAAIESALTVALGDMRDVGALQAQATAALIPLCRGDNDLGPRMLDHVTALAATRKFNSAMGAVLWARGWAATANGDPRTVADSFAPLWSSPLTGLFAGAASAVLRVRALVAVDDVAAAQTARDQLLGIDVAPEALTYLIHHSEAIIATGVREAASAARRFDEARRALNARIRDDTAIGLRLMSVVLAEDWARFVVDAGDPRRAEECSADVRAAVALLLRAGAKAWRERLETLLARLPAGGDAPLAEGYRPLDRLTAREREIAQLLLEGRSNKEIAASLVLSVRTVEFHVRNLLAKLGVVSRLELRELLRHMVH